MARSLLLYSIVGSLALLPRPAEAQFVFANVHSFSVYPDGAEPNALVQGSDGNFYGTASGGGTNGGNGVIFQLTTNGVVAVLHDFAGSQFVSSSDGGGPAGGLVLGSDGSFYGTTEVGGAYGVGTVFNFTSDGTMTILHSFTYGPDGAYPDAALALGSDGNLYGTTLDGGTNGVYAGTIFKITTNGTLTSLYSFTGGDDGKWCRAALLQGRDGSCYGTTTEGGANGNGTIFKITTNGVFTSLYSFPVGYGYSTAPLVQAGDGSFYGTTQNSGCIFRFATSGAFTILKSTFGGSSLAQGVGGNFYGTSQDGGDNGDGSIFSFATNGALTVLYSFTNGLDGGFPSTSLVQGSDGIFYGTDGSGAGFGGTGTIFSFATNGTFMALYQFPGSDDGQGPNALVQGADGNLYGTTGEGGTNASGNVFTTTTNGDLASLYSFTGGGDGGYPSAPLAQGADGNFYGTTSYGGIAPFGATNNGNGTLFEITSNGLLTTLYSFSGPDGVIPNTALARDNNGNLYGTTSGGGAYGNGTIFQWTAGGAFSNLYSFTGSGDGSSPNGLVLGSNGDFYGTAPNGGTGGYGTVFKMTTDGVLNSLYSFGGTNDGGNPLAPLVQGQDGDFYGTTSDGGTNGGFGTIFKITANGSLSTLYNFGGNTDGGSPSALLAAADGNFYGTTEYGGTNFTGAIFEITPGGTLTVVYSFTGGVVDGGYPLTSLMQASDGSLYGTTSGGAGGGYGGIFRLSGHNAPTPPVFVSVDRTGEILQLNWTVMTGFAYQVQYVTNLNQNTWFNLGSPTNETGSILSATDFITNSQRFYRVKLVQ